MQCARVPVRHRSPLPTRPPAHPPATRARTRPPPPPHRCVASLTGGGSGIKVEAVVLPDGEQHKSLGVLQAVWDKALEARLDRNTTFVALGGGVVGDMCGFAAAAYQRGVHFVQVPTTVMSQARARAGGGGAVARGGAARVLAHPPDPPTNPPTHPPTHQPIRPSGGLERGGQDGREPPSGQEHDRRVLPAALRAGGH